MFCRHCLCQFRFFTEALTKIHTTLLNQVRHTTWRHRVGLCTGQLRFNREIIQPSSHGGATFVLKDPVLQRWRLFHSDYGRRRLVEQVEQFLLMVYLCVPTLTLTSVSLWCRNLFMNVTLSSTDIILWTSGQPEFLCKFSSFIALIFALFKLSGGGGGYVQKLLLRVIPWSSTVIDQQAMFTAPKPCSQIQTIQSLSITASVDKFP